MLALEHRYRLAHGHGCRLVCCGPRSQRYLRVPYLGHGTRLACFGTLCLHHGRDSSVVDCQETGLDPGPQLGRATFFDPFLLPGRNYRLGGLWNARGGDGLDPDPDPARDTGAVQMRC